MIKENRRNILPKVLIVYMLFALLWWSLLLFRKNNEISQLKLKSLQLESNILYKVNAFDISSLPDYEIITSKHNRQRYMIIGEGIVFAFILIVGVNLINRAYNKELEASDRQNNFLLSITHELRSPLASILLILETIKKRVLTPEKIKELSSDAIGEGLRLEKQINNLLLASKLDKRYVFNLHPEDLIPLTNKIIERARRIYSKSKITFLSELSLCITEIDKESYYSMMNNLIENAIKYSHETEEIVVKLDIDKHYVVISIEDQGIGISDADKKMVKQQFFRVGNENTRNTKGTGLGLFIVDKIIKAHRGKLSILDNNPKGSIMKLKIPYKR